MKSDIWREVCTFALQCIVPCGLLLISLVYVVAFFQQKRKYNHPPSCGRIPWIGCVLEFGAAPLEFMGKKIEELGPLYTIHCMGQTLHVLTKPELYQTFFDSPNLDFEETVFDAITKAGLINKALFIERHTKLYHAVKSTVSPLRSDHVSATMCHKFREQCRQFINIGVETSLFDIIKKCMYLPIIQALYGDNVGFRNKEHYLKFMQAFERFDRDFELGVQLPSIFTPKWKQARNYLLKFMISKFDEESKRGHDLTLFDELKIVTGEDAPNYAMMVMLAALSNAVPVAFWTLAYVLSNERVNNKLRAELDELLAENNYDFNPELNSADLKRLPYLSCCIQEALRLCAEGVVGRRVVKDFKLMGYDVPKGGMVVLCPYWAHRDERFFPDPLTFTPERWESIPINRMSYKQGFIAFGGGKSQCPGRFFGYMVIQKCVASFLLQYNCTAHSPVPKFSMQHLVGVQHPMEDFKVTCNYR